MIQYLILYTGYDLIPWYHPTCICRPEKVDFIKMATLMDAIVVPFAAIGVSDSVNFILDGMLLLSNYFRRMHIRPYVLIFAIYMK